MMGDFLLLHIAALVLSMAAYGTEARICEHMLKVTTLLEGIVYYYYRAYNSPWLSESIMT